ncbi:MFS transporter [Maritalea porphyrae]|uniref:MFS transporter n=1 Tax=Maritalea porphyrae TaxID=880732 RepID=UPI0022AFDF40|nr:MFS transporter [Maritalea porphyrae]MCZ4271639.1 MFS transporter [Maritalea porphyrae]
MKQNAQVNQNLWRVASADFLVRTAYQMGKSPLLPLFAASLGAGSVFLGLIVSVSTMTGLFLKPIFGYLSDRSGRRLWMLIGVGVFAVTPFLYWFVKTPEQLFALRLIHGLATAIFGPVTLAYVASLALEKRATRQGWFGLARSGSYLIAPTAAAWALTWMDPAAVFTVIGCISLLAFLPVLALQEIQPKAQGLLRTQNPIGAFLYTVKRAASVPVLWFAGSMEMTIYISTYALKAFLPIYAHLELGVDLLTVGLFFSIQEGANLLARPFGGKLADRFGLRPVLSAALCFLGGTILILPFATTGPQFLVIAMLMGGSLGVVLPTIITLYSLQLPDKDLGLGMGLLGTIRNLGKVAGPIVGGLILTFATYTTLFVSSALLILLLSATIAINKPLQENTDFV